MAKRRGPTFIQRSRSKTPSEKAQFHQVDGAGRTHVKRPFFELNANDETAILNKIQDGLDKAVQG